MNYVYKSEQDFFFPVISAGYVGSYTVLGLQLRP